jgi:hypothetical protein
MAEGARAQKVVLCTSGHAGNRFFPELARTQYPLVACGLATTPLPDRILRIVNPPRAVMMQHPTGLYPLVIDGRNRTQLFQVADGVLALMNLGSWGNVLGPLLGMNDAEALAGEPARRLRAAARAPRRGGLPPPLRAQDPLLPGARRAGDRPPRPGLTGRADSARPSALFSRAGPRRGCRIGMAFRGRGGQAARLFVCAPALLAGRTRGLIGSIPR